MDYILNAKSLVPLTDNQKIVNDFITVLSTPPSVFGEDYSASVRKVGSYLGVPKVSSTLLRMSTVTTQIDPRTQVARSSDVDNNIPTSFMESSFANQTVIEAGSESSVAERNATLYIRNAVLDFLQKVSNFASRAYRAGFSPPDNPFYLVNSYIFKMSIDLHVSISPELADSIVFNMGAYVDLIDAEESGKLNIEKIPTSSQISSYQFSLDGVASSGDTVNELLRFIPSMDEINESNAIGLLSAFDFSKRIPEMIFSAEYSSSPDSKNGIIVCWKKMADASGYILRRRNVFDGSEAQFTISNGYVKSQPSSVLDYIKKWALSFYDTLNVTNISYYVDDSAVDHACYIYKVSAYQNKTLDKGFTFSVDSKQYSLPQLQRTVIINKLKDVAVRNLGPQFTENDVSPYPLLSEVIFGNSKYDWVLSGINVRKASDRNANRSDIRKYSYIGSDISFIFKQMDAGEFYIPADVKSLVGRIDENITEYGLTQTLIEVLRETGTLNFFDERDNKKQLTYFTKAGSTDINSSPMLKAVIAAIDPTNAILDLRSLSDNLPKILDSSFSDIDVRGDNTQRNSEATPKQNDVNSASGGQSGLVDMLTFDGIGTLLRVIRVFSDFGTNKKTISNIDDIIIRGAANYAVTVYNGR